MENKCCVVLGDVNQVTDFDHSSVGYYQSALHKSEQCSVAAGVEQCLSPDSFVPPIQGRPGGIHTGTGEQFGEFGS